MPTWNAALNWAVGERLIKENVARGIETPMVKVSTGAPTVDEIRRVMKVLTDLNPQYGVMACLLATTGLRRGEVLGLRWEDIDAGVCAYLT